jgi:glycosyltransferase involved in cell wall biosynthesis
MGLARTARQQNIGHVHIHSCAKAAHLGALANILDDLNYSLTLHGDLPVYGTDHAAKMKRARFVSAVTRPLQKSLETSIGKDRPYPLIWMGVDTDRFRPAPNRRPRASSEPLHILTVARLNAAKGHIYSLRAIARLREEGIDIRYRIAGEGAARHDIEAEIKTLGIGDRVVLLGSVSEETVLSLLHEAHVVALTSFGLGEAAPVAVMEAMACGVPCIVSVIGGTPDMIDNGRDGILVPQKDVEAIADAMRRLAAEPGLLDAMSEQARKKAEETFDHRQNALKLYAAIQGEFA